MTPAEYRTRRLREFRMTIAAGVRARDRLTLLGPMRERPDRFHRKLGLYRLEVIPGMLPVEELTRKLRDSRPDVLWVYPTVLKTVLNFVQCELYELVRPRILITSSQVMAPVFRDQLLAANAGMEIVDIYGSAEAGRIAAVCPARQGLHVEEDALILELLNDRQAAEAGAHGTVVLTCLDQFAMPLIRYEQGDLCRFLPDGCSCGRQTPLLEPPIGRNADMITLPSGRKISCFRLDVALRHETTLRQYRFVQERLDHIEAQLCFTQDPTAERMHEIRRCLESQMEEGQTLSIRVVPELQLTGLKFKVFVSRLN
jgi:phenylacetate-CoA ligase